MATGESKALQVKEKKAAAIPAESTRPGVTFTPSVDIFETEKEIVLLADMPGVKADALTIDLRDNVLTLTGTAASPQGDTETAVWTEYRTGNFYRQFTLSELIDQARIEAEIKEGVLRLIMPKVEKATPRKISVKAG